MVCLLHMWLVEYRIHSRYLAIFTLLQPPIVRTGLLPHTSAPPTATHRAPTTRDIPPVTLTNVPHIDNSVFQPYLSQVGPLVERSNADGDEHPSQWLRRGQPKDDEFPDLTAPTPQSSLSRPRPSSRQNSSTTVSLLSPVDSPQTRRRQSSLRMRTLAPTPLSSIPSVYFEENFHLENPRTFDIVSERSEVIPIPQTSTNEQGKGANGSANGAPQPPRKALSTNAILQEKLSWYLDTVEIHLISSISTASKSFFAALGSLKDLHNEAEESVKKIHRLREDLEDLDQKMAIGGLEIVKMKQRREDLRKLAEAVHQLSCIVDGASHCESLVSDGELETAIERIQVLEDFTCGHLDPQKAGDISWLYSDPSHQLLDLRQLKALDGFAEGMDQLRLRVGKGYEARFIDSLLKDLREHVKSVPNRDTLKRWARRSSASQPRYLETNAELRQQLSATLRGLHKAKYTTQATKLFRDQIMKEVKSIIRQHLPSSSDDDADSMVSSSTRSSRPLSSRQEKSAILARNLRALSAEDAEQLFISVYCGVGEALRRLQVQMRLLLDISSGASPSALKSPRTPKIGGSEAAAARDAPPPELQEQLLQTLDMSSLLGQAVDAAHTQITRVLKVRAEETAQLSPARFLRYFALNRLFADECEAVSGRSGTALRGVVDVQIREFIGVVSDKERQHLAQTMEEDRWDAWDVTERDAKVLEEVLLAMEKDPESWIKQSYVWEEAGQPNGVASPPPTPAATETNGTAASQGKDKEKTRPAMVSGEPFNLPKSSILLLHGLSRFLMLLLSIPRMSEALSSAIIDYLRLFNSRCNQLVLFAGATRSAGLQNINTKHLALASQALGFIVALVPYVRETVRRKAGAQPGMVGRIAAFDALLRDSQRCQLGIHEKLVDIMSARAATHVKAMRARDFDAEGTADATAAPSKYVETLTKETALLHRVLSRHLAQPTVGMIMLPVFANYREQFGAAFRETQVRTEAGKERYFECICSIA